MAQEDIEKKMAGMEAAEQQEEQPKAQQPSAFEQIRNNVSEDDDAPVSSMSLRKILLKISKLEQELVDIKYKALSSSSNLTERCRESRLLEALRQGKDSVLQITNQPPYIINVGE